MVGAAKEGMQMDGGTWGGTEDTAGVENGPAPLGWQGEKKGGWRSEELH